LETMLDNDAPSFSARPPRASHDRGAAPLSRTRPFHPQQHPSAHDPRAGVRTPQPTSTGGDTTSKARKAPLKNLPAAKPKHRQLPASARPPCPPPRTPHTRNAPPARTPKFSPQRLLMRDIETRRTRPYNSIFCCTSVHALVA
jgi:hypothetical protein